MKIKKILIVFSVLCNIFCTGFLALAFFAGKTASVSFLDLDSAGQKYATGVSLISVPEGGGGVVFGPAEFSLHPGEKAALQFSAVLAGRQLNLDSGPLYDRGIVRLERSPYGLILTALREGETALQAVTPEGIRDIARVTVLAGEAAR